MIPTTISRTRDRAFEAELAKHIEMIEGVAQAVAAESRSQHYGAELDDLIQEGRIALWTAPGSACKTDETLEDHVYKSLRDYVSFLGKQRGAARGPAKAHAV